VGILGLGFCFSKKDVSSTEYFLAGRTMGWFPIGLSVMVTVFSAVNYVAFPNEVFGYGLAVTMSIPVFILVAVPITRYWIPFFHGLKITSAYEYLEQRFDSRVRILASGMFILWRLLWMATALYAAGTILSSVTHIPAWTVILIGGMAATLYTTAGGMRAVMWTDVAQFVILFGSIVAGLFITISDLGWNQMVQLCYEGGRLKPFYPLDWQYLSFDPTLRMTLWSVLIGVFVAFLSRYGADQVVLQRYFTASDLKQAQRGFWLNVFAAVFSLTLLALLGLAVYAHAVSSGVMSTSDVLTPVAKKMLAMKHLGQVIRSFPAGVTGLVAAGLFAATMSSMDSGINTCCAAWTEDFHKKWFKGNSPSGRQLMVQALILGLLVTCLAFGLMGLVGKTNSLFMIVNKLINGLGSPLLALFLLGMFTKQGNASGAFYGGIIGFVLSAFISLGIKNLALQYYAVANLLLSFSLCFGLSVLFKSRNQRQLSE
jgi:SSS family transporter